MTRTNTSFTQINNNRIELINSQSGLIVKIEARLEFVLDNV